MRGGISDPDTLRQVREQTQVDAIVLGSVSQYTRANLGFTARLVSLKSGLVLWSISQTGGSVIRPSARPHFFLLVFSPPHRLQDSAFHMPHSGGPSHYFPLHLFQPFHVAEVQ